MSAVLLSPVKAAEQTVKLAVPGMTCITCPITVNRALQQVDGVISSETDYETREATVVFDDETATVADLEAATRNAGYPATLKRKPCKKTDNG